MAGAMGWVDVAGFLAAALIAGVGVFVLAAKPGSRLHLLFFALAILDAASTALFGIAVLRIPPSERLYYWGTYWYHFIGFIALLALFGLVFPKPVRAPPLRYALIAAVLSVALAALMVYAVDHAAFWLPAPDAAIPATFVPAGNLVNISFMVAVALLVLRLTRVLMTETSESHRRQAAFVLGGMALAYLPYATTVVAQDIATLGLTPFLSGRWDRILAHWAFLAAALSLVASGALLLRHGLREEAKDERAFVLSCYAGVLALGAIGYVFPSAAFGMTLRTLALLAYPVLLGYSIVRYEVFDIDRQLRRAATVTLAAVALTAAFILAESALENVLTASVFAGLPSGSLAGGLAALVTAVAFIPVARASRKAASKLVPELSHDELYQRKREIYLHSLAGALADGILKEGESRTLAVLRESLGITDAEHRALLHQVQASS